MTGRLAALIDRVDVFWHDHFGKCPPALCLAADVVNGWGPSSPDWHRANRFHRWLHRRLTVAREEDA